MWALHNYMMAPLIKTLGNMVEVNFPGWQYFIHVTYCCWKSEALSIGLPSEKTTDSLCLISPNLPYAYTYYNIKEYMEGKFFVIKQ